VSVLSARLRRKKSRGAETAKRSQESEVRSQNENGSSGNEKGKLSHWGFRTPSRGEATAKFHQAKKRRIQAKPGVKKLIEK
jgi:hypothetical protein